MGKKRIAFDPLSLTSWALCRCHNTHMTVNEYIQRKVQPEYRAVTASLRRLMRETAPKAEELISYGMPCYLIVSLVRSVENLWIRVGLVWVNVGYLWVM